MSDTVTADNKLVDSCEVLKSIVNDLMMPPSFWKKNFWALLRRFFPSLFGPEPPAEVIVRRLFEHYAKLEIFTKVNAEAGKAAGLPNQSECWRDATISRATAYRLAATDLFVERALEYLRRRAESFKLLGLFSYTTGAVAIAFGGYMAHENLHTLSHYVLGITSGDSDRAWAFASHFVSSFTFYGFVVLLAVTAWRFGKAMLDQSERLYEKRHAVRQGRLYVHLKDGKLNIEELEKAFLWNVSQPNAFSDISTDAKAPWGSVVNDSLKAVPEIVRAARGTK